MAFGEFLNPAGLVPGFQQLNQGLGAALSDPRAQAALLSFGAQAAQPMQWGQTGFGHLMSSVAAGGAGVRQADELARKEDELEIKRQEADSKQLLRQSQAELAESRAGAAGVRSGYEADRLLQRERELDQRRSLAELGRQRQFYNMFFQEQERIRKHNENDRFMNRGRDQKPIMSFEEFMTQNPVAMRNLGLTPESFRRVAPSGDPNQPGDGGPPAPTSTAVTPTPVTGRTPRVGEIINGFRFKGGNPRLESSWERATP